MAKRSIKKLTTIDNHDGKNDYVLGYMQGVHDQARLEANNLIDINVACKWLEDNFYHEETMCDSIAYKHENYEVSKMVDDFRKAMEELHGNAD